MSRKAIIRKINDHSSDLVRKPSKLTEGKVSAINSLKNWKDQASTCSFPNYVQPSLIPSKLRLRLVKLDTIHKAFLLRIKNWKVYKCHLDNEKLDVNIAAYSIYKKSPIFTTEKALWNYLIKSIKKGNKFFTHLTIEGDYTIGAKISSRHKIPNLKFDCSYNYRFKDYKALPGITSNVKSLEFFNFDISPELVLGICRLYKLEKIRMEGFIPIKVKSFKFQSLILPKISRLRLKSFECPALMRYFSPNLLSRMKHIQKLSLASLLDSDKTNLLDVVTELTQLVSLNYRINDIVKVKILSERLTSLSLIIGKETVLKKRDFTPFSKLRRLQSFSFWSSAEDKSAYLNQILENLPKTSSLNYLGLNLVPFADMKELADLISSFPQITHLGFHLINSSQLKDFFQNLGAEYQKLDLMISFWKERSFSQTKGLEKFFNSQRVLQKLNLRIFDIGPDLLRSMGKAIPSLSILQSLSVTLSYKLETKVIPTCELCFFLESLCEILSLRLLKLDIINYRQSGNDLYKIFQSFRKFDRLDILWFSTYLGNLSDQDVDEIIDFINTRDRKKIKNIFIIDDYFREPKLKYVYRIDEALKKFQGLSLY